MNPLETDGRFELQHDGPFERRQTNRAILLVLAMALAAIAVNGGIHSFLG